MARHLAALLLVLLVVWSPGARAQDRPVVFVHGMAANSGSWAAAAERLRHRLAITPFVPSLPWQDYVENQANNLQGQLGTLPPSTIAVAHSLGGVVSRQWNTIHPLSGIVSLGTPHSGAPLVDHLLDFLDFNVGLYNLMGAAGRSMGVQPNQWSHVFYFVQAALLFGQGWAVETVAQLAGTVGMAYGTPVLPQISTSSYLLGGLNSTGNLARERADVSARVGLSYVARNYWQAGPARAIAPEEADYWYDVMSRSIYALEFAASYLVYNYPSNAWALDIADKLFRAAGWLRQVDPTWCWAVTNDGSCNTPHDGVVPWWSQLYPGATVNYLLQGPAHKQENKVSDEALVYVLQTHADVKLRGSAGPVPGGPGGGTIASGECVEPNTHRYSADGRFQLSYQGDGNLVLYRRSDGAGLWHTATFSPGRVCMQHDGNLVVYDAGWSPLWSSSTHGFAGAIVVLQNDGNLVIYDYYGFPRWASNTAQ